MTPARKRRLSLAVLILLASASAVALINFAFKENIDLFYTTTQIAQGEAPEAKRIRVGGLVEHGSVVRDEKTLEATFRVSDGEHNLKIYYEGILPDLFREGQGIVAQGMLNDNGDFIAQEVLAKHDEEYMPAELAETLGKYNPDADKQYQREDTKSADAARIAGGRDEAPIIEKSDQR